MRKNLEWRPIRQFVDVSRLRPGSSCDVSGPILYRLCRSVWIIHCTWRGEARCLGNSPPSISPRPGLRPGEDYSSLASRQGIKSGSSSLPVISHCSIGVEHGARGCFRRWVEYFAILLDSLPPTSSWAALSQKVFSCHGLPFTLGAWG